MKQELTAYIAKNAGLNVLNHIYFWVYNLNMASAQRNWYILLSSGLIIEGISLLLWNKS